MQSIWFHQRSLRVWYYCPSTESEKNKFVFCSNFFELPDTGRSNLRASGVAQSLPTANQACVWPALPRTLRGGLDWVISTGPFQL